MATITLGIETSCDDTSIAIIKRDQSTKLLAHNSFSQEKMLKKWGGVVPEIAARNHLGKLIPLLKETLNQANIELSEVDFIGVTTHPGLLGPLLTGLNCAKTLSLLHKIPIIPVNHLFAHLEAIHLEKEMTYPYLGVLVSGGHSAFFWVEDSTRFTTIGSTIDDAAGEAFDKGGKLLGLGYPAGKIIDQLSQWGDPSAYNFPIGLKGRKDANLSFSGLKTALRNFIEHNSLKLPEKLEELNSRNQQYQKLYDVCASYQKAIVDALAIKCKNAVNIVKKNKGIKEDLKIVLGGGVACNSELRAVFQDKFKHVHFVPAKFCTDNGAMIANYAARNTDQALSFPQCLSMDAKGRYLDKKDFQ